MRSIRSRTLILFLLPLFLIGAVWLPATVEGVCTEATPCICPQEEIAQGDGYCIYYCTFCPETLGDGDWAGECMTPGEGTCSSAPANCIQGHYFTDKSRHSRKVEHFQESFKMGLPGEPNEYDAIGMQSDHAGAIWLNRNELVKVIPDVGSPFWAKLSHIQYHPAAKPTENFFAAWGFQVRVSGPPPTMPRPPRFFGTFQKNGDGSATRICNVHARGVDYTVVLHERD